MNATQVKYARERAQTIQRERLAKIKTDYAGTQLSRQERVKALRRGDYSLIERPKDAYYIGDLVQFHGETPRNEKAIARETAKVQAAYQRFMDELVLGDNEAAMKLLEAFANG